MNSHSTMYLLKPIHILYQIDVVTFTFHHVSIKTMNVIYIYGGSGTFTFHHVSIKTPVRVTQQTP